MSQQIIIIGMGQFGMSLAKTLSQKGAEVLAADTNKQLVEEAATFVTEALVLDGTDENQLAGLAPSKRSSAVCAIGDESRESSIICTALLRQMGTPFVIARANDTIHQRILQLVGAHMVVNPENEFGKRFANRLLYRDVIENASLGEDLQLTELRVQPSMEGKTLVELALPKKLGIIVAAIRNRGSGRLHQPSPNEPLQKTDNIIIVSNEAAVSRFIKEV